MPTTEDDRLCTLVLIGARPDGTKELVALEDGYRESTDSWATVLRDLKRRGMRAPVVAVGDGALGFWAAVRDVWPETQAQRDWCHTRADRRRGTTTALAAWPTRRRAPSFTTRGRPEPKPGSGRTNAAGIAVKCVRICRLGLRSARRIWAKWKKDEHQTWAFRATCKDHGD